jgi:hypothetical protein
MVNKRPIYKGWAGPRQRLFTLEAGDSWRLDKRREKMFFAV